MIENNSDCNWKPHCCCKGPNSESDFHQVMAVELLKTAVGFDLDEEAVVEQMPTVTADGTACKKPYRTSFSIRIGGRTQERPPLEQRADLNCTVRLALRA